MYIERNEEVSRVGILGAICVVLLLHEVVIVLLNVATSRLFCCFVDFQIAFDSVWREGLLLKLIHNKIGGLFYHLISDMYLKSQCAIKYGNQRSKFFEFNRGVIGRDVFFLRFYSTYTLMNFHTF